MHQQTLSHFGVRKDVQVRSGRWLREHSPEYMREGHLCKWCGRRIKCQQALGGHRRHVHNERRHEPEDAGDPHWAWRFLQGAQPHADGVEPVVVGGDPSRKKKTFDDGRRGAEKRQRYTAAQKLHAVDHWLFARESGLKYDEAVNLSCLRNVLSDCEGLHFLLLYI